LVQGDEATALEQPHSIVITQEMAEKYFGDADHIWKVLTVNNRFDFTVTGVLKNIPPNSILQFDMLVPFEFLCFH
jgi:putative ABC transport system permease protein